MSIDPLKRKGDNEYMRQTEQLYLDYSYGIIEDYSELVEKIRQLNRVREK